MEQFIAVRLDAEGQRECRVRFEYGTKLTVTDTLRCHELFSGDESQIFSFCYAASEHLADLLHYALVDHGMRGLNDNEYDELLDRIRQATEQSKQPTLHYICNYTGVI